MSQLWQIDIPLCSQQETSWEKSAITLPNNGVFKPQWFKRYAHYSLLFQRWSMDVAYWALQLPMHLAHQTLHKSCYWHHFFPREENACLEMNPCPCGQAQLETCEHVLFKCTRYNRVVGDTLDDIIDFVQGNPDAFSFRDNISISYYLLSSLYLLIPPLFLLSSVCLPI